MVGIESRRAKYMAGAALLALTIGVATPAAAQAQPQPDEQPEEETQDNGNNPASPPNAAGQEAGDGEEIVVTGFRRSLENAVAEKLQRDQIVESVSAEDIGKLPDASIAESIARLPGLTSQRLSGRANVISIRGFGPDFSTTLLNGREQTSTSDNRNVEFDQYPSEVVRQVNVFKSPTASLVGQGLVGTVDIRTVRPLDFGGRQVFAVGGRVNYSDLGKLNAESRDTGYRVNATYVDQFADDSIGLAVAASYVDEPYQIQEFNAWGYNTVQVGGQDAALIGGSKSYVTSTDLRRFGVQATGQYRASPELMFTVDAFHSDFEDDQIKRGIELPLGFFAFGRPETKRTRRPKTARLFPASSATCRACCATMPSSGRPSFIRSASTPIMKATTAGTLSSTSAIRARTATSSSSKAMPAPATGSIAARRTPSRSRRPIAAPSSIRRWTIRTRT
jgi:iron complex outermembrane receptor protein